MISYLNITIFVTLLCYSAGQLEEDESENDSDYCVTVNDEYVEGTCLPLRNCPQLIPMIKLKIADREYLKMYHCGFDRFEPKVCCRPAEMTTTTTTTSLPPTPHNRCRAQSGSIGSCVPIQFCPKLDDMMMSILTDNQDDEVTFTKLNQVSKSRCQQSSNDNVMHVCCGVEDLRI